jgi:16S rRNA (guanine966-N2)-methyltransferase
VFVESSREACSIIMNNLAATGCRGKGIVRRADAERFLARRAHPRFGLAFLDPPYARGLGFVARILGKLGSGGWIREGGTLVVESAVGKISWPEGFRQTKVRPFGRTQIALAVRDDDA